jgi:RNA polymerase sigma-70 factor (ECF subfamily)
MSRASHKSWWAEARAIARRHVRGSSSDAADDLAQDMAVAALERPGHDEGIGAWLERVGRNAAIDRWRSERRRAAQPPAVVADALPDPEALLLGRERRSVVRGALAALPRDQRRAALLRFHHDLPFAAVACRLGTEEGTARTRVHRALARMRERLAALRAIWVGLPGAHAAALGLVLALAAQGPEAGSPPPRAAAPPPAPVRPAQARTAAAPASVTVQEPQAERPGAGAGAGAVKRYIFGNEEITGSRDRPDIEIVTDTAPAPEPSLIEIRRELYPELLKSLEDL